MTDVVAVAWRQYRLERKMFWRNPTAAFFNFLLPLLFLALFGAILAGSQSDLNVIVPGIAGMAIVSTTFVALAMNLPLHFLWYFVPWLAHPDPDSLVKEEIDAEERARPLAAPGI